MSDIPFDLAHIYYSAKHSACTHSFANLRVQQLIERTGAAEAKLACLPADWQKDSSLETWFPFTAEELVALRAKVAEQAATIQWLEEQVHALVSTLSALSRHNFSLKAELATARAKQPAP